MHLFGSSFILTLDKYRNYLNERRGAQLIFYLSEWVLIKKMQKVGTS